MRPATAGARSGVSAGVRVKGQSGALCPLTLTPLSPLLLLLVATSAPAQDSAGPLEQRDPIHWAYSSFLGTGFYKVSDDREVFILDLPLGWDWREPAWDPETGGDWGLRFDVPVNLGVHRIDFVDDLLDLENYGTLGIIPGIVAEVPLSERWRLMGYGHFGWGTDLSSDERAWIWDAGLRSHVAFRNRDLDWGLFGEAFAAGYLPNEGSNSSLGGLGAGVDFAHPVSWRANDGTPLLLTWDLTWRWYADELTFRSRTGFSTTIDDEWRVSVALARSDGPIRLWFMEFDQLGLSYRVDSEGQFQGITVNFSAPFDR